VRRYAVDPVVPGEPPHPGHPHQVEVVPSPRGAPTRVDIEAGLHAEGLTPHSWSHGAAFSYGRHVHGDHKVLVCVSGSIVFHTDAGDVALGPGDRMEIPSGVGHAATVGGDGVECVEAYRRESDRDAR